MTDTSAYDRLLGRSRTRDAIAEREARKEKLHNALRAALVKAGADSEENHPIPYQWATAIVERMHAEADAERVAA